MLSLKDKEILAEEVHKCPCLNSKTKLQLWY